MGSTRATLPASVKKVCEGEASSPCIGRVLQTDMEAGSW